MHADPLDPDPAFDFVVTAESLCEWPDAARLGYRHGDDHGGVGWLLLNCHLAIGAKHFTVRQDVRPVTGAGLSPGAFDPRAFDPAAFQVGGLAISHGDIGEVGAGTTSAFRLAREVLTFWERALT